MKTAVMRLFFTVATLALFSSNSLQGATTRQSFGTNNFIVDPGAPMPSWSQSTNALLLFDTYALGDTLWGDFSEGPFDWTAFGAFGLRMSLENPNPNLPFTNPNLPFTVRFFDSKFDYINTYTGDTSSLDLTPSVTMLSLSLEGNQNFTDVVGMQFTWDGGGAIQLSVFDVVGYAPPTTGFFVARAPGGVEFLIPAAEAMGSRIPPNGTTWEPLSDSNAKTDVTAIDHREVLEKVSSLPVTTWQYLHNPDRPRIGPMAQDFREAFGLGFDDKHISTMDADGVALAALKGLIEELQERKDRSATQAQRLQELQREIERLQQQVAQQLPPSGE